MNRSVVCWPLVAVLVLSGGVSAAPSSQASLTLEVLLVSDPDFPEVTRAQADTILTQARATLADKLGFSELRFKIVGTRSLQEFLSRWAKPEDACAREFASVRVVPGKRMATAVPRQSVVHFLKRWSVQELQSFFPPAQRKGLNGYEVIAEKLALEFDRKVAGISSFKLANGRSLLAEESLHLRSYVTWICAMRAQDEVDLVLTNAFVLYDLGSEPYPHSIFQKCKVGGASLASPKRRVMRGRAMMSSTFSMMTSLPFFQEEGVNELSMSERQQVIGAFIVAHEMGHALFKLPDFYDHPPECLMTTKYETGYVSGFHDLRAHPGSCPRCSPHVQAKRHVFAADRARVQGDLDQAIAELRQAIRLTPSHVDGNYLKYMSDLSVEVAELYAQKGDTKRAKKWLSSVLRRMPQHARAKAMLKKLRSNR